MGGPSTHHWLLQLAVVWAGIWDFQRKRFDLLCLAPLSSSDAGGRLACTHWPVLVKLKQDRQACRHQGTHSLMAAGQQPAATW